MSPACTLQTPTTSPHHPQNSAVIKEILSQTIPLKHTVLQLSPSQDYASPSLPPKDLNSKYMLTITSSQPFFLNNHFFPFQSYFSTFKLWYQIFTHILQRSALPLHFPFLSIISLDCLLIRSVIV